MYHRYIYIYRVAFTVSYIYIYTRPMHTVYIIKIKYDISSAAVNIAAYKEFEQTFLHNLNSAFGKLSRVSVFCFAPGVIRCCGNTIEKKKADENNTYHFLFFIPIFFFSFSLNNFVNRFTLKLLWICCLYIFIRDSINGINKCFLVSLLR